MTNILMNSKGVWTIVHDEFVWGIFVAENTGRLPNFFPIALYTTSDRALENIVFARTPVPYSIS
ncbi:hypothetical protein [Paenibacillus marchantiophytorum]|uniref:hypothetical protein n=1 Tax=Paenibacillus marchantiophytorum TaxID=1619310 RepID=UPI0016635541|nr:hypothetical protein [Paenibacillus marchantiophytorum]